MDLNKWNGSMSYVNTNVTDVQLQLAQQQDSIQQQYLHNVFWMHFWSSFTTQFTISTIVALTLFYFFYYRKRRK